MSEKKSAAPAKRALSINEFCEAYNVSRATAYRLIADGKLAATMVLGKRLIPVDAAEALLNKSVPLRDVSGRGLGARTKQARPSGEAA
jgi:excisionase family DNA binding protein